jgi:type III pantothenate kinase
LGHFLFLDHGNTATKGLITDLDFNPVRTFMSAPQEVLSKVSSLISLDTLEGGLYSSVGDVDAETEQSWRHIFRITRFSRDLPLPVRIDYETPHTLGTDRLASAIGAGVLYPGEDVLILDFGTCLKCDLLTRDACYRGGSISPGLNMRYKSMHTFTAKLPLLTRSEKFPEFPEGKSTAESMHVGVMLGLLAEAQGMADLYRSRYPGIRVLVTGGDAEVFEGRLKNAIFVRQNLALLGLAETKKYHANNPDKP